MQLLNEIVISFSILIFLIFLSSNSQTKDSVDSLKTVHQYFSPYGKIASINGNFYKSKAEAKIAKFLERKKIRFIYEYPIKKTTFKTDFYLVDFDIYVEYWGLVNLKNKDGEDYRTNHQRKKRIYEVLKLHLVSIYPQDLNRLPKIFEKITYYK